MLFWQDCNSLESKGHEKNRDENKSKSRTPHFEDNLRKKKVVRLHTHKDGMPNKRFHRIVLGSCLTIIVVCPIFFAIALRTLYDDSTKYIFHQLMSNTKNNELRVIQVIMDIYDQEFSKLIFIWHYVNIKHKYYKNIWFRLYISVEKYMILKELLLGI